MSGERLGQQRGLYQCRQAVHPATHIGHASGQPHLGVGWQSNHARWARQSSTARSARASTIPRTRIVVPMKMISMQSEDEAARNVADDPVLTGTSDTLVPASLAGLPPGPYSTIHRRSRLALIPLASAVLATETPGRIQLWTNARLPATLYVRRPPGGARTTRPSTTSTLFSAMCPLPQTSGRYP